MPAVPEPLQISARISVVPVIHGSGDFAWEVRRWMLDHDFDCLAVPLPMSFQESVERAVLDLPAPAIVIQPTSPQFEPVDWAPSEDGQEVDDFSDESPHSYVPIDPCQPVIMAIRVAMGERVRREFIDLETDRFQPMSAPMPDPFALKRVPLERFAAAMLPGVPQPADRQTQQRIVHMACRLHELEEAHKKILLVCSVLQWPWIRQAYRDRSEDQPEHDSVVNPTTYDVRPRSLNFLFGELPFITGLYERARSELEDDEFLSVDGVKQLLIESRKAYLADLGRRARRVTPLLLGQCLKYIRNLSLIERRMTPDLYTIASASKQVLGDQFALHVVETARTYPYASTSDESENPVAVTLGIDQARLPDNDIVPLVSRLPGPAITWQKLELMRRPSREETQRWQYRWNPYGQCSYPPEDEHIENFRTRVFERAQAIMGADLARTEKFTTSVKDGIDIRDTLRHWYEQQIYVKVLPPDRGQLDCCVMLFDSPSDPRDYPWRTTWFAEHEEESTLAFYATDFSKELVGPGIGLSVYGGAMFLYPPVAIPDIWHDHRIDFVDSLEERLIAAACTYSRSRQIAVLSSLPPGAGWRRLAKRFHKHLVHVPMGSFSDSHIQQLRMVHVLNGKHIRSYAANFIRKA